MIMHRMQFSVMIPRNPKSIPLLRTLSLVMTIFDRFPIISFITKAKSASSLKVVIVVSCYVKSCNSTCTNSGERSFSALYVSDCLTEIGFASKMHSRSGVATKHPDMDVCDNVHRFFSIFIANLSPSKLI